MAKEENSSGLSDLEVEEEVRKIEAALDAEPGLIDLDRMGKAMIILGTIFFVTYMALLVLSTMVLASDSWGMFNFWSIGRFLVVTISCIGMIIVGYLMTTNRSIPS